LGKYPKKIYCFINLLLEWLELILRQCVSSNALPSDGTELLDENQHPGPGKLSRIGFLTVGKYTFRGC